MTFPTKYKCLPQEKYGVFQFEIIPIRYSDKENIRLWRNSQTNILRQQNQLTEEDQNRYFLNSVLNTFQEDFPNQILFTIICENIFVGYGGLVHIDFQNKNAEISFLLDPKLENSYLDSFSKFLELILIPAKEIGLIKIFTVGYNVSEKRFLPLIQQDFCLEACQKEHVLIDGNYYDQLIYSKFI